MKICIESDQFQLIDGQSVGLPEIKGTQVQVLRGALWVTQEGDRRDLLLHDNDFLEIERDGVTVLQALGPTRFQVAERRPKTAPAVSRWKALGMAVMRFFFELGTHRAAKTRRYRL